VLPEDSNKPEQHDDADWNAQQPQDKCFSHCELLSPSVLTLYEGDATGNSGPVAALLYRVSGTECRQRAYGALAHEHALAFEGSIFANAPSPKPALQRLPADGQLWRVGDPSDRQRRFMPY
jgi:hypothetical protein